LKPVDYDPFLLDHVAAQGNGADRFLAHMSPGDLVIPEEHVTPEIRAIHAQILGRLAPRFTVGHPQNSINGKTGLIQFEDGGDGGDGGDGTGGNDSGGGAVGGGSSTGGLGGGYGGFGEGVGQSRDSSPGETGGQGLGGETGTGHDLGQSGWGSGMVGGFGNPTSGIGLIDKGINAAVTDPGGFLGKAAVNIGIGMVPGLGLVNTASGLLGGPTIGGAIVGGFDPSSPNSNQGKGFSLDGLGQSSGPSGMATGAQGSNQDQPQGPINSLTTTQNAQGPAAIQAFISQASVNPLLQNLLHAGGPLEEPTKPQVFGNPYINGGQGNTA